MPNAGKTIGHIQLNGFSVEISLALSQTAQIISHLKQVQNYGMAVSPEE